MQGIRGAITVEENTKEEILQAAQELIAEMCRLNAISPEDIGAVIFSATDDITAAFPAAGARRLPGFDCVPLFDTRQKAAQQPSGPRKTTQDAARPVHGQPYGG